MNFEDDKMEIYEQIMYETYSYPSALHSDSATVSKMSLVFGVSKPSVHSLPDSPFSENMAKPSVWNFICCGVSGFGSDVSDNSGAIDTKHQRKKGNLNRFPIVGFCSKISRIFEYVRQSFSSKPSGQSILPSQRAAFGTHVRPRPQ